MAKAAPKKTPKKQLHDHAHNHENHTHSHEHDQQGSLQSPMIAPNTVIKLTAEWQEVEPVFNTTLKQAAKSLKVAGFRPGKVPVNVALQRLDLERITGRVLEQLAPRAFAVYLEKNKEKHQPVSMPEVKPVATKQGDDWEYEIHFGEKPQLNLKNYKKAVQAGLTAAEKRLKEIDKPSKKTEKSKQTDAPALSEQQRDELKLQHVFQELVKELKPAVAELLIRQETDNRLHNLMHSLDSVKLTLQDYLSRRGQTSQELVAETQAEALASLQVAFILQAIQEHEKLAATEAELKEALTEISDETMKNLYSTNPKYQDQLHESVVRRKTTQFLLTLK